MTINGQRCSIVDYCSMSLMQLEAKNGCAISADTDLYNVPGLENVERKYIKKYIQKLINSIDPPTSFRSRDNDISKGFAGVDFKYANNAIWKHLEHISKYFGTGVGMKLMYEESAILIIVLQKLMELKIPALPLHDAVITTRRDAEIVREVMEESFDRFYQTTGSSAKVEKL